MYRTLDANAVIATIEKLEQRIFARFPNSGLLGVCRELGAVASESRQRAEKLKEPNGRLRLTVAAVLAAGAMAVVAVAILLLTQPSGESGRLDALQGIDSGLSIVAVAGASVFFLLQFETRRKRSLAVAGLEELRSLMHVIDMHQLTKDPSSHIAAPTDASPARLAPELMVRYLDYCSEMLSLAAKVAALHAQSFPDAVVLETVNDLERLATGLSQKIWQKITIIDRELSERTEAPAR